MPSPNVELVRSILMVWERGEFGSAEWAHPRIQYVVADGPAPGNWVGLAGMAKGARANLDTWRDFRFAVDEYRELDAERVLVLTRYSGRGKTSGLDVGQIRSEGANLFHVAHGRVRRLIHYWDRERALADLGLSGPLGKPDS